MFKAHLIVGMDLHHSKKLHMACRTLVQKLFDNLKEMAVTKFNNSLIKTNTKKKSYF